MSAAIINMALVFGLVQLANKYQLDAPENTNYLRLSYGSVQLVTFIIIGWIYYRITKNNDTTKLVYSEPKSPFQAEEPEPIVTTNKDYDLQQTKQLATQTLMGIVIISVMHYNWGYLRRKSLTHLALLLQSVLGFKTLSAAPIVRIWLFGRKAEGELLRPFKTPSPFGGEPAGPEVTTPKELKQAQKKEEKKKIANKKLD